MSTVIVYPNDNENVLFYDFFSLELVAVTFESHVLIFSHQKQSVFQERKKKKRNRVFENSKHRKLWSRMLRLNDQFKRTCQLNTIFFALRKAN